MPDNETLNRILSDPHSTEEERAEAQRLLDTEHANSHDQQLRLTGISTNRRGRARPTDICRCDLSARGDAICRCGVPGFASSAIAPCHQQTRERLDDVPGRGYG